MLKKEMVDWLADKLPDHWRKDEESNNYKTLTLIANSFADRDEALKEMKRLFNLSEAYGSALDDYGVDIGLSRGGLDDDRYRRLLKAKRYLDMSDATIPDLNLIFDAFMTDDFLFIEEGFNSFFDEPASFIIHVSKNARQLPLEVAQVAKAGGVRIYYSATYDKLLIRVSVDEYEYKVYYPITNIYEVGWQRGKGDFVEITVTTNDWEHKAYYPIANIHVCGGWQNRVNDGHYIGEEPKEVYFLTPVQPTEL